MLAHLDEVLIEASPRFRVRVSVPGARRHFSRSGSSAVDSRVCPGSVTVLMSSQLANRLKSPQKPSNLDVLLLKTSYKHQSPPSSDARQKINDVTDAWPSKYRETDFLKLRLRSVSASLIAFNI